MCSRILYHINLCSERNLIYITYILVSSNNVLITLNLTRLHEWYFLEYLILIYLLPVQKSLKYFLVFYTCHHSDKKKVINNIYIFLNMILMLKSIEI